MQAEGRWGMIEDSLGKVKAGLRRGLWLFTLFLAASEALGFARFYVEFVFKSIPKPWIYGYLVVANVAVAGTIWYVAYRVNPRVLDFVQHLSVRLREADYVPWGTKKRGLLLVLDRGLLLTVSQNFLSFRLVFREDGTVLMLTLEEWPSALRVFRRAKRRAFVSSRKGGGWQRSELERIRQLLGSRSAVLLLYERTSQEATSPVNPRWIAVAMFFVRKWWQQGDAVRNTADEIEKLLVQMEASPVS